MTTQGLKGATTTTRVSTASSPSEPQRRSGSRGAWVFLCAAVLVLALLVGGFAYLTRYQPLVAGNGGYSSRTYVEGAKFSFATELINQGHIPITVTAIEPWTSGLLRTTGVMVGRIGSPRAVGDISPRHYLAFHTFSLAPGQSRAILIRSMFYGCKQHARGTTTTYGTLGVKFSALGVPRTAVVLVPPLTIHAPNKCAE